MDDNVFPLNGLIPIPLLIGTAPIPAPDIGDEDREEDWWYGYGCGECEVR